MTTFGAATEETPCLLPIATSPVHSAWRVAIAGLVALLAVGFAWIVPLGEAPDELAHIRYAEALAQGLLPSVDSDLGDGYEAHQPPLGYLLPAIVIALRGGLDLAPDRDPTIDFHRSGSRAFRVPFAKPRDALTLRLARTAQACWLAIAVWMALPLAGDPRGAALFWLAPQLLFAGGTIGNDVPLVAFVTATLVALSRFTSTGDGAGRVAASFALALLTKASAVLLLAPIGVALWAARRQTRPGGSDWRPLAGLTAGALLLSIGFQLVRTGSPWPSIPTAHRLATLSEPLLDPSWLGGLFRSYWAKFGWLNTPLPGTFYFWFGLLSIFALVGLFRARDVYGRVLQAAVAANFALLFLFQILVDRQAQGRYLFPSIAAVSAAGAHAIPGRWRTASLLLAVVVALYSLDFVRRMFR